MSNFIIFCGGGGGGGGSSPDPTPIPSFSLTLGLFSFSTNEDEIYTGSVNASANENVTLEYLITSQPSNGNVQLSSSGAISYSPKLNYFGSDQFEYSVRAVEKNVTKTATVNVTVNAVNDPPVLTITQLNDTYEMFILMKISQFQFRLTM